MSQLTNIEARIMSFFSERLNVNVPGRDSDLLSEGILDSLTFVDLLLYLEEEFNVGVSLDELDLANFTSVGRISAYILGHSAYTS